MRRLFVGFAILFFACAAGLVSMALRSIWWTDSAGRWLASKNSIGLETFYSESGHIGYRRERQEFTPPQGPSSREARAVVSRFNLQRQQLIAQGLQWRTGSSTSGDITMRDWLWFTFDNRSTLGNTTQATVTDVRAEVPYWILILILLVIGWATARRARLTIGSAGCCAKCGYDLRATPERCPECGTEAAKA